MKQAPPKQKKKSKRPRSGTSSGGNHSIPVEHASPLHVVECPAPHKPIGLQSKDLLKDLLHPLDPVDFMREGFRNKAVHIKTKPKDGKKKIQKNRFQSIIDEGMCRFDTKELLQETSSDSIFVWLASPQKAPEYAYRDTNANSKPEKGNSRIVCKTKSLVQSIEIPDANTALALHQSAGCHALYCRAPPAVEQILVSQLLRDTGLGCGQYDPSGYSMTTLARGEVEMFITAKPGGTTDWHYDFQENFTLQLSGVKRWHLQRGTVAHPLRACTPHYNAPEVVESQLKAAHLSAPEFVFDQPKKKQQATKNSTDEGYNAIGPVDTATLHPGDVLYFPAGMWHKIEVLEEGVSINVSLIPNNYASITCQALQHYLLQHDEWRQAVVHNTQAGMNAQEQLTALLEKLPGMIGNFNEQCGGAAKAILPPVLMQPPKFQSTRSSEDSDREEDIESTDNQSTDSSQKPSTKKQKTNEKHEMDADNAEDWEEVAVEEDVEEGDGDIIDVSEFKYPSEYTGPCRVNAEETVQLLSTHRLIYNPLASLLRMDEVSGYYSTLLGREKENDKHTFVLNINYAGLESHESSIRVILRDDPEQKSLNNLHRSWKQEKMSSRAVDEETAIQLAEESPSALHCLLYHGFLILVPK